MAWQEGVRGASRYLSLGVQLAGTMLVWVIGGLLLDRWLDTTPWLTVAGSIIGMVAFFYQILRLVKELEDK